MSSATPIKFGTDGWRAVIGDDFTYENLRRVADAAGRVIASENPGGTVYVGYDCRFQAGTFAGVAAEVIAAHGLVVKGSDCYCPTPALCFAVSRDDAAVAGVMLTASHNPAQYLGFKLRMSDGGASPVAFTDKVEAALTDEAPAGRGAYETVDIMTAYLDDLRGMVDAEAIHAAGLKVAVDPLHGAGRVYLAGVLREMGVEVTEIHGDDNYMTIKLRSLNGHFAPLNGPVRAIPDDLQVTADFTTKILFFTVGFAKLAGDVTVIHSDRERGWFIRFTREPDWRLPAAVSFMIHSPLKRPFEGSGSTFRLVLRENPGAPTIIDRHTTTVVEESTILRFIGRLGATAMGDFVGNSESEENRFSAEVFYALRNDIRALLP